MTEICTFSTFTHVRQTCFSYNFFGAFGAKKFFSTDLKSAWNSDTFFIFFKLIFLGHISTFSNCEAKRAKNYAKNKKKRITSMCLRFKLCTQQKVCVLNFLKKSRILCTLLAIQPYCVSLVVRRHHSMTCQQGGWREKFVIYRIECWEVPYLIWKG